MVSDTPNSNPEGQDPPPTGETPAWGIPWRQWLKPIVVVTFLIALLAILISTGSARFQSLRSDINSLRRDVAASETRLREDLNTPKTDIKEDLANLKTSYEEIKIGILNIKEGLVDLREDNGEFKTSIKKEITDLKASNDIADIKGDIRALNDKLDQVLGLLAAED